MTDWFVYILECSDGTLYTGITDNVERRLALHNSGKGARYTKGRCPVVLRYSEKLSGKGEALRREWIIKKMPRISKEKLLS